MAAYRLASHVEDRILAILDNGARKFGNRVRDRYAALIIRAMQDVADNPGRPGVQSDPKIDPRALFYHIRYSRMRAAPADRIGIPRHILIFEIASDGVIDILGIIPDMIPSEIALPRFMPERFRG